MTDEVKHDLSWWRDIITHIYNNIFISNPDRCIKTDGFSYGWGGIMESKSIGGLFSTSEQEDHVNALELKTVLLELRLLAKDSKSIQIKVLCNNSTAVACINKLDTSRSLECDSFAKEIWDWAVKGKFGFLLPIY